MGIGWKDRDTRELTANVHLTSTALAESYCVLTDTFHDPAATQRPRGGRAETGGVVWEGIEGQETDARLRACRGKSGANKEEKGEPTDAFCMRGSTPLRRRHDF